MEKEVKEKVRGLITDAHISAGNCGGLILITGDRTQVSVCKNHAARRIAGLLERFLISSNVVNYSNAQVSSSCCDYG